MEACAGAHWMVRQLSALGHEAKLISPQFVRALVKGNKDDFIDAEAICEAAGRPSMRFVTPKTEAQQCLSALHRTRESLVRDRVKAINQIHGFLPELGIGLPIGPAIIKRLPSVLAEHTLPARLVGLIERLRAHIKYLDEQLGELEKELGRQLQDDDLGQRLMAIPGVGPITASALLAEMGLIGAVRAILHARPGPAYRPPGAVGLLHAETTTLERRRLRPGEQAGPNSLVHGNPPHRIQNARGRHITVTASRACCTQQPTWFCDADIG